MYYINLYHTIYILNVLYPSGGITKTVPSPQRLLGGRGKQALGHRHRLSGINIHYTFLVGVYI